MHQCGVGQVLAVDQVCHNLVLQRVGWLLLLAPTVRIQAVHVSTRFPITSPCGSVGSVTPSTSVVAALNPMVSMLVDVQVALKFEHNTSKGCTYGPPYEWSVYR